MAILNFPLSSTAFRRPWPIILVAIAASVVLISLVRFREPGIVLRAAHIALADSVATLDSINNATLGVSDKSVRPLLPF